MKIPILNISQFKKHSHRNDVYINTFSNHIKRNKNLINKPHSHNFYLCVLFTKGTGIHEIDFNSYTITPGKIFFLKPGQTHFWKFKTQPEGYIFFHSQEFYELAFLEHTLQAFPFYYSYQNPPVLDSTEEKAEDLQRLFKNLHSEYLQNNVLRELKIVNLINHIYIDLTRMYILDTDFEEVKFNSYSRIIESLETLVNIHFQEEKFPKFYAEKLNISTKHLNRVVKKTINKTTSQLIAERTILEAKRLMVHSQDSLTTISHTLNFSDYAYFSKFFKSKTGLTPLNFRKKYFD
ncbi:helix-turn-helix domain-containing protein [Corallibacter sp.]|uniref:helix-turn-helix domain-containing protein n=1 Tax=Corallibacter sp. TaxID=2038084 RepID=UPI003AB8684E